MWPRGGLVMTLGEGPLRGLRRGEAGAGHAESWPLPRSVGLFTELSCAGKMCSARAPPADPGETSGKYCILCARCDSSSWSPSPPWGSEPPREEGASARHTCALEPAAPGVAGQEHPVGTFLPKAVLCRVRSWSRVAGALSTPRVCD